MKKNAIRLFAVLTITAAMTAPTFGQSTWVGGGSDSNWTTGANWQGGVAPVSPASLTFSGANVTNANDYAANTQFNGITFAAGASGFTLTGNAINLGGAIVNRSGNTSTISLAMAMLQNTTVDTRSANVTIGAVVSGTGFDLMKTGTQTLTLTGANIYTGATQIDAGTLSANFNAAGAPTSAMIDSASALILGGPSQSNRALALTGKNNLASTQNFTGTTLKAGRSAISATRTGSGSVTLNLGSITREKAALAHFTLPAAGNITVDAGTPLANGILGGWATVGTDWATHSGGTIAAYSAYTDASGGTSPQIVNGASTNVRLNSANNQFTLSGGATTAGSAIVTVADTTGLVAGMSFSGSGAWIPAGAKIVSVDNSTQLTISANSISNGTGLTHYAGNPVTMPGAGVTDINTLILHDNRNWQIDIGSGKTLRLGGAGAVWRASTSGSNTVAFVSGTLTAGGANNTAGELILNTGGVSDSASRATTAIRVDSVIADNGSGKVALVKTGPQIVLLNNTNTHSGGTYVQKGRLSVSATGSLGSGDVYVFRDTSGDADHGQVLLNGGVFNNNFFLSGDGALIRVSTVTFTLGALVFGANNTVVAGNVTLMSDARIGTADSIGTNVTISGKITGDAALTFFSGSATTGTIVLSNSGNDWTGNTTITIGGTSGKTDILRAGASEVIPNGAAAGNLVMSAVENANNPKVYFELNGYDETINGLNSGSSSTAVGNRVVRNSTTAGKPTSTFTLGDNNASGSFFGTITNGQATSLLNLRKIGSGTQVLSGVTSHTGTTVIENGTLDVTGTLTATSNVTITGGIFAYSNAAVLDRAIILNGGTFRHTSAANYNGTLTFTSGRLAGTNWNGNLGGLTIGPGQTVAPGTSPGEALTDNQAWAGGGSFEFEINATTGTAGVNWDKLTLSNTLDISALSSSDKFTIELVSLDGSNVPGLLAGFDKNDYTYEWEFASFATLNGTFSSDKFTVDTSGFQNDFSGGGFVVTQDGNALYVSYIPEPATVGLALSGLALALLRRRRG